MYWLITRSRRLVPGLAGLLVFATGMSACVTDRPSATLYPVDSLVSAQIHLLVRIGAALEKEALFDGEHDTVVYRPDSTAWKKELDIFLELDNINKPVNRNNYEVSDGLRDSGSNLLIKEFKSTEKQPIVYLKVYYQGALSRPRKIDALYEEINPMFKSRRQLTMRFDQVGDETVLTAYSVQGGQRIVLSDSISYYINGKVLVD